MPRFTPHPAPTPSSRHISGVPFIAGILMAASTCGGAAAFADANRFAQVRLVSAPEQEPIGAIMTPAPYTRPAADLGPRPVSLTKPNPSQRTRSIDLRAGPTRGLSPRPYPSLRPDAQKAAT